MNQRSFGIIVLKVLGLVWAAEAVSTLVQLPGTMLMNVANNPKYPTWASINMGFSGLFYALLAYFLLFHTERAGKAIGVWEQDDKQEIIFKEKEIASLLFAIVGLFLVAASISSIIKYFADFPMSYSNAYLVGSVGAGFRLYFNSTWTSLLTNVVSLIIGMLLFFGRAGVVAIRNRYRNIHQEEHGTIENGDNSEPGP